ncbi:hypothetical protein QJS10_CPA16g00533 [Acorus calamus]|uniref:Uncharacterized protein n=1 Tax=Acorus calamus TaxID=4465 RepID=A0AAV9D4A0_ACOCL|nr:hypothetical protein QJS10_CPA16g00533 [Acorus calamus]
MLVEAKQALCLASEVSSAMEGKVRFKIPAFGNWDLGDDLPITQYFDSETQAGLTRGNFFFTNVVHQDYKDDDLKKQPSWVVISPHKVKKGVEKREVHVHGLREQKKKQRRVCDVTPAETKGRRRAPKAVDEDLYKIPPELLSRKPRKRVMDFWISCLGLNCLA